MSDILTDLRDLHRQATVDRSHFYVGSVLERAIREIERLRKLQAVSIGLAEALLAMREPKPEAPLEARAAR